LSSFIVVDRCQLYRRRVSLDLQPTALG